MSAQPRGFNRSMQRIGRIARPASRSSESSSSSLCITAGRNGYHTRGTARESINIALPRSRLVATIAALRGVDPGEIRLDDQVLELPGSMAARLRNRLTAIVGDAGGERKWSDSERGQREIRNEVYQLVVDAYLDAKAPAERETRRIGRCSEIVRRAEERFIAAGSLPISLADLCAAAGVGRTALQQAFNELYGESPLNFLHKRRLMQAREALVHAPNRRSAVKCAALGAGLNSLGRFSVEYRLLFGESPSATLSDSSA